VNRFIVALHESDATATRVSVIATRKSAHEAIVYARKHWPYGIKTYHDHMDSNNNGLVLSIAIDNARLVTITDIHCLHARTLSLSMPYAYDTNEIHAPRAVRERPLPAIIAAIRELPDSATAQDVADAIARHEAVLDSATAQPER
jgi:hypothetical protein